MHKLITGLATLLLLTSCAGRSAAEVFKGSCKKYPGNEYWNVFGAAQSLLQKEGFIVNLTHQSKGILVATLQKTKAKNRMFNRVAMMTGATFREGDYLRVFVNVSMTKKQEAEMRISVLRERENEWTQEDGDEIGNPLFYVDFFKRVDKTAPPAAPADQATEPPPAG